MKKYSVSVMETLERIIEIDAENENDAYEKVRWMYKNAEIILDCNDYMDYEVEVLKNE